MILQTSTSSKSTPSLSTAIFLIFCARALAAKYSIISDCDETFNYWEPLHFISYPSKDLSRSDPSFQTWENAPEYGIRSWAYLLNYSLVIALAKMLGASKVSDNVKVENDILGG